MHMKFRYFIFLHFNFGRVYWVCYVPTERIVLPSCILSKDFRAVVCKYFAHSFINLSCDNENLAMFLRCPLEELSH